jgi:hypothetical protein
MLDIDKEIASLGLDDIESKLNDKKKEGLTVDLERYELKLREKRLATASQTILDTQREIDAIKQGSIQVELFNSLKSMGIKDINKATEEEIAKAKELSAINIAKKYQEESSSLYQEISLLGLVGHARDLEIAKRKLGASATDEQAESYLNLSKMLQDLQQIDKNIELRQEIDLLKQSKSERDLYAKLKEAGIKDVTRATEIQIATAKESLALDSSKKYQEEANSINEEIALLKLSGKEKELESIRRKLNKDSIDSEVESLYQLQQQQKSVEAENKVKDIEEETNAIKTGGREYQLYLKVKELGVSKLKEATKEQLDLANAMLVADGQRALAESNREVTYARMGKAQADLLKLQEQYGVSIGTQKYQNDKLIESINSMTDAKTNLRETFYSFGLEGAELEKSKVAWDLVKQGVDITTDAYKNHLGVLSEIIDAKTRMAAASKVADSVKSVTNTATIAISGGVDRTSVAKDLGVKESDSLVDIKLQSDQVAKLT